MNEYRLGKIAGLELTAAPSALIGALLLWAFLTVAALLWAQLPLATALVTALLATLLHVLSELIHQLGHAAAAQRTRYPMEGIRFWGLVSTSVYPPNEPRLSPTIHIQRALGGPMASLLLTVLAAASTVALRPVSGVAWLLALFFYLDNLLVFTLGALLPLGFTDGSTLLYWFRNR